MSAAPALQPYVPPPSKRRMLDALLRNNLGAFTQRCFNELTPAIPYEHNWHIDAITYHLSLLEKGPCRRLIIALPPRHLKSVCASIAFPAWLLGRDPTRRIICASYGGKLIVDNANGFRRIVGQRLVPKPLRRNEGRSAQEH